MNYRALYSRLTIHLREQLHKASMAQVRNQAAVTQALAFGANCHLTTLAMMLPVPGQRENLVQRIRRWLDNQAMLQYRCYIPLVVAYSLSGLAQTSGWYWIGHTLDTNGVS